VPPTIGRYVIEDLIGVGGMGQIYKAHDPDIRRTVAIKLISTELMSGDDRADYIRRFRREAEAAARCAHPNIITVYDFALHEGQPFLAMEFVYGQSLRQRLNEASAMSVPEAIWIMLQVLDALSSAHAQGVIHQDIKPANIMVTPDKRVKVGDFGISRLVNTDFTIVSDTVGTPAYMSPEQCRGERVDLRTDLYSAGATLFELVTGERAFRGRSVTEVSHRVLNDRVPLLPPEVRATAPRLQSTLERAMAKQQEERFESASAMAAALRQVLANEPIEEPEDGTRLASELRPGPADPTVASRDITPHPVGRDITPPPGGWAHDADLLRQVEDKLRVYVGPIARILVRNAAGRTRTAHELCEQLARDMRNAADRERFRHDVQFLARRGQRALSPEDSGGRSSLGSLGKSTGTGTGAGTSTGPRLPDEELARAQAALTQYVGPIARILVRRAAANISTVDALWQALSEQVPSAADRAAFLRQRPK
jgi:serine/threonine-protein kinase